MNNGATTDINSVNLSNNDLDTVLSNATSLVNSLTRAFSHRYRFTISAQNIDCQNSPELAQVKGLVREIPQIEFQTAAEICMHLYDSYSRVADYRRQSSQNYELIKNEPEYQQSEELRKLLNWLKEETDKFGSRGERCIVNNERLLQQRSEQTAEQAKNLELKIKAIHMLRDKTEYWEGFWDAIEGQLLPDSSIAEGTLAAPIVALALWVGGLIASGAIYHRSWGRKKLLEVLQIWEDKLTTEQNIIQKAKDELLDYNLGLADSRGFWTPQVYNIWRRFRTNTNSDRRSTIVQYSGLMDSLQVVEKQIWGTHQPFVQVIKLMYPLHGPGISAHRNVNDFCEHLPHALDLLKRLLTIKAIICSNKQEEFQKKVHCLARLIYGHLEHIQQLCAPWSKSIDPEELAAFIEQKTPAFLLKTDRAIQASKQMLETEVRNSKATRALQNRSQWDRRLKITSWTDRPLISLAGALEVLKGLEDTIMAIYRFSVCTGTGTNMSAMEGIIEAQRSHPEFNHSNSLLQDFFRVLGEEIQRGSLAFPEKEERSVPPRRGWHRWFKGQKQKPEAFISGL